MGRGQGGLGRKMAGPDPFSTCIFSFQGSPVLALGDPKISSHSSFLALCRNISGNIFSSLQPGVFDELPALKVV